MNKIAFFILTILKQAIKKIYPPVSTPSSQYGPECLDSLIDNNTIIMFIKS